MIEINTCNFKTHHDICATFVFVSDLHEADHSPVLELIQSCGADGILVGGDYIHNDKAFEKGFEFLRQASKLLPTFCVLGNHEMRLEDSIRKDTLNTGAVLLDDASVSFKNINICGLTTGFRPYYSKNVRASTPPPNLEKLAEFSVLPGFKLLLSHHPEYYPRYIRDTDVDLTLSGHAHGGQWRFFGRGFFAPGQGIFPKYTSGLYENRLLVSRGIGNPHLIPRINNSPEIIILKISKS